MDPSIGKWTNVAAPEKPKDIKEIDRSIFFYSSCEKLVI